MTFQMVYYYTEARIVMKVPTFFVVKSIMQTPHIFLLITPILRFYGYQ